jgi:peptide/nickel transport system substrate-binding protein
VAGSAFGYNPNVKPYPYDPAKARALLAEAGHAPNSLKFVLEVIPGAFPADGEIFQQTTADLQKAGFAVESRVITFNDWLPKFNNVTWDNPVWQNSWNAAPVMDASTAILNQSCNKAKPYLCDPKQQALLDAAATEFDVDKRRKILQDLVQLQHDEAINIFLVSYNNIHAHGANVQGFRNINNTITYEKMSFK